MSSPSTFTAELGERICDRIAEGESLRAICREEGMPNISTVIRWALYPERSSAEFVQQYARAREIQAEVFGEELRDIVDDGSNDWMEREYGDQHAWVVNGEAVQRSKLRFDQRRWWMSKVLPKKYGDKIDVNHGIQTDKLGELKQALAGGPMPFGSTNAGVPEDVVPED